MHKNNAIDREKLYRAILTLKDVEECAAFFEDIGTIQEIDSFAQRLDVACALCDGASYNDINKITGASTATICRVSRALNYGAGGYKKVIERLGEQNEED